MDADEDIALDGGQVTPIALAVNEAVSNALKHAFEDSAQGCIEVGLHASGPDRLALSIADDGRGFAPGNDVGLGLKIQGALSTQLGGDVTVARRPEGGTLVTLILPRHR